MHKTIDTHKHAYTQEHKHTHTCFFQKEAFFPAAPKGSRNSDRINCEKLKKKAPTRKSRRWDHLPPSMYLLPEKKSISSARRMTSRKVTGCATPPSLLIRRSWKKVWHSTAMRHRVGKCCSASGTCSMPLHRTCSMTASSMLREEEISWPKKQSEGTVGNT